VALNQPVPASVVIVKPSAGASGGLVAYSLGEFPNTEHPLHNRGPMAW